MNLSRSNQATKFLSKCDKILGRRIEDKLESLRSEPVPSDAKFIRSKDGSLYRVRVGNYRILYTINFNDKAIFIVYIDKRSNVYNKIKDEEFLENIEDFGGEYIDLSFQSHKII